MSQHVTHPSLMELKRKKSAQMAKEQFLEEREKSINEMEEREYDVIPSSIDDQRLKKFTYSGDKYFKILVNSIQVYKDKSLKNIDSDNSDAQFNQNDIVEGAYIDNKRVLFGTPYNVYCNAKDVEPIDIDHKAYLHKQKEQRMKKKKHIAKSDGNRVDLEDAVNGGNDDEYIDVEAAEKTKLIGANKPKDPSLSDYISVGVNDDKKNVQKGYYKVENGSDNDGDGPLIIIKRITWYNRYPYNQCVVCLVFLCILILDILLMVFLSNLNGTKNAMDTVLCDEEQLMLIYDVKYMTVSVVGFIALIVFYVLMYFGPQIAKRNMGTLIVNGVSVMMIMFYLGVSVWQMIGMSKEISGGIDGVSEDIGCNTGNNSDYIENMRDGYDAINTVIVLKIFQGICLCVIGCSVVVVRSMRKN